MEPTRRIKVTRDRCFFLMCFPLFATGIVVDIINHFEKIGLDLDCLFFWKRLVYFLGMVLRD